MHQYNKLLRWYYKENVIMPWRENTNPYRIWISEIMLQQTQVKTVIPYYIKWMKEYPTIEKLSKASLDDLLYLWQGLGYYNRVNFIHKSAKIIQNNFDGHIPNLYNDLIKLNGVGDYTASAILSIAFNQYMIPIDGNIKRIVSRVYQYNSLSSRIDIYKEYAKKLINKEKSGHSVQALMDLGRIICKPRLPLCTLCPINKHCLSHTNGLINQYPEKIPRKKIPTYKVVVGYIIKNKKFLISKRPKIGLLSNLWELPGGKIKLRETKEACLKREIKEEINIRVKIIDKIGTIKHQYSHFKVIITLFKCKYISGQVHANESQGIQWINWKEKKQFAFPTATHKLFQLLKD